MGELITQHDILLHLPTVFPDYPYRVERLQREGKRFSPALEGWWRAVAPLLTEITERLKAGSAEHLPVRHPLSVAAAAATPPCRLWSKGTVGDSPYLVVIGPRQPSSYAQAVTRQLVAAVAPYVTVVSGMAYGIDTLALQVAAAAGGRWVAVSPSGVETLVPAGSVRLVKQLLRAGTGAVVSEYQFTTRLGPAHFLHRNRLLAALATVLLVVEAAPRSGTMSTVKFALNRGTTVAVVPGDVSRPTAMGSNQLIRDGAQVVLQPADLAGLLGIPWREREYPPQYRALVVALERGCTTVESLAETLSLDLPSLSRLLLAAEQDSIVSRDQFGAINFMRG